jgi:antitoxin MazE
MHISIRKMGNSSGVIIPKPLLVQLGVATGDSLDMSLEAGRIVLAPARLHPRAGWAAAAAAIVAAGDTAPAWPDFANEGDADLTW